MMHPGHHATSHPDSPAIILAASGAIVTYGELEAESNRLAHFFRSIGLRPGDGIALLMENCPAFLTICWAAQRAGLYYTCIATHLTAAEAAYIVNDCGSRIFVTSGKFTPVAQGILADTPEVSQYFVRGAEIEGYQSLDDAAQACSTSPIDDETEGADLLYSSGTTGRPKGIKVELDGRPFGEPTPRSQLIPQLYSVTADTVYLSTAPLYHAAPLRFCMTMHRFGATIILMEKFDAEGALAAIDRFQVTHSQWVPTMFVRLLRLPENIRQRYGHASLRVAIHAAAPCPVPVKQAMIDWWGPVLHEYYAGTEGNGMTALDSAAWLAHKGSVGKPVYGEVHIVDEAGNECAPGTIGRVYFSGAGEFRYHNDPDKTAAAHDHRGWSTLGDIGYIDDDGYLYLTGRAAHMIISGGVNIYPQEIENLLLSHPEVADAAVIGVPHDDLGEAVKAVVQPVASAGTEQLAESLLAFCRDNLSHVKCPRSVDFRRSLPREANGKLYKQALRDAYWKGKSLTG